MFLVSLCYYDFVKSMYFNLKLEVISHCFDVAIKLPLLKRVHFGLYSIENTKTIIVFLLAVLFDAFPCIQTWDWLVAGYHVIIQIQITTMHLDPVYLSTGTGQLH